MKRTLAAIGCCLIYFNSLGQVTDSTSRLMRLKRNNIFQFFRNAVTRGQTDSATLASTLNAKAEDPFLPYQGKGIRHIIIKEFGFEKVFADTSKRIEYFGTKILNNLHRKTRDWVIRNNLFIHEHDPVDPYRLANNEKYLRSLEYIQDARILVNYLPDNPDSVDLVIVVKDLFSINGAIGNLATNSIRGNVSDANVLGLGQKVRGSIIEETTRSPNFGYELFYSKSNIGGTFITTSMAYTQINPDLTDGTPDEHAWYIRFDRPLYSPYAHYAGAFIIGNFRTDNNYKRPDSLYYDYHYRRYDGWIGRNLGSRKFLDNNSVRDRKFFGIRYLSNDFSATPYQYKDQYVFKYNDRQAVLGEMTFFRQDFYKTNYIYGQGTTEDVSEGYNVSVAGGWYRQLQLKRPYAGVDANRYVVTHKGDFIQYFLRSGVFIHDGGLQDANILFGASMFSRLFLYNNLKIRQYLNFSYARQFNRVGLDPLRIDNLFGLRYFNGDSTYGLRRISLHTETFFFTNIKMLSFKMAPFAFADLSLLTPEDKKFAQSQLYQGLGAGVRTRNENLVFGTIELRFIYFPNQGQMAQNNTFKITLNTNIQFRLNSNYVHAPNIVQTNTDNRNDIY